jgi:hypothetical protein
MTRSDAIKLVGLIVTAYPNSDKFNDSNAINNAVNLWAEFFTDDDAKIVAMALKKHIATCKWPPQIAEIKEIMLEICVPDIIPPDEAWVVVALHLDNSGEYECLTEPEKVFPLAVAKAIKAVGYRTLRDLRIRRFDHSGKKTGLDRVAFLQAYEPEYERTRKNAMLPASLQAAISHTQTVFSGNERQLLQQTRNNLEVQESQTNEYYRRLEYAARELHLADSGNTNGENGKVET